MSDLTPPQITIDDYQALIDDSLTHMSVVSNGQISDSDPSGFMRPYCGTLAFLGSELLYKANLSSKAASLTFLSEVVGIPENVGKRATTTIEFGLSTGLANNFLVPANFQLSDSTGTIRFYTDADLVIPSGAIAGSVSATAEEIGSQYNLDIGSINRYSQPLSYLSYVTNVEPATGGEEPESVDDLVERAAIAIRTRSPVSSLDFQQLAQIVMGEGSRCKAIGLLGPNKVSEQKGAVHLFLLDKNGTPANISDQNTVGRALTPRLQLGTKLHISEMELVDVAFFLFAEADGTKPLQTITDECFAALTDYFNPKNYPIGQSVLLEEVKFILRSVGGFRVEALEINDSQINLPMPNEWSLPLFKGINFQIIGPDGQTFFDNQFIIAFDE